MSCSSGRVGVGYEGDTCSFTCNTGYELTGSDTRTCQSDGSWSGSDDVCRRGKNSCIINVACLNYLKLSYYSGTLILAIFCRQGFSIFLF